jgi:hypothetical protein
MLRGCRSDGHEEVKEYPGPNLSLYSTVSPAGRTGGFCLDGSEGLIAGVLLIFCAMMSNATGFVNFETNFERLAGGAAPF